MLLLRTKKQKFIKILAFIVVFVFTFILRAHSYERVPTPNHLDEQLYALSGINLIETGTPVSWSTLDYPKSAEVFKGEINYKGGAPSASVTLYKPWLDEPPLFSLFVGEAAHLFHADRNGFIPSSYIRFPVVLISSLTSIFIFLIALEVSGFWTGILAMLVYGTEPIMVFASRTAMPETLIAFLFCITIYLLIKFMKSNKFGYILPIPVIVGLAGLSKPTGYFILGLPIFIVFTEIFKKKPVDLNKIVKYTSYLILGTLPFVVAYILYGYHFSPEIFKRIISIQGFRPAGFNSLVNIFITPSFSTSVFKSGWYIFCFVSAIFFIFKPKTGIGRFISLTFVYWLIIVMMSSGENDLLAWYRFPSFPLLAILGVWGIQYVYDNADFFTTFIASGLLLGSRSFLVNAFHPNVSPNTYRFTFAALLTPSLINTFLNKKRLKGFCRAIIIGIIAVGMWWNVKYIYNAYEIECESKTCPMVPTTSLSRLYYPVIWRFLMIGKPVTY